MDTYSLPQLGWHSFFESSFSIFKDQGMIPARVSAEHKQQYVLMSEQGNYTAEVSGRIMYTALSAADFPKVGDWVALFPFEGEQKGIIQAVLPRQTKISRKHAGSKSEEQIIAANIDWLFIVMGLDRDFNPSRLDRYVAMAHEGGVTPIVLLNKADLPVDVLEKITLIHKKTTIKDIYAISAKDGIGIEAIAAFLERGKTIAVVGSSGAGKSTLINRIMGNLIQQTGPVRETDGRGRHTTTHRELFVLPGGGILIDTPGMRELQLWQASGGITETFGELEHFVQDCRFKDCTHTHETDCAVITAVENGELDRHRYENYLKLRKEQAWQESLDDRQKMLERKKKWKQIQKQMRKLNKGR